MKKVLFIFTLIFLALGVSAQYSGKGPVSLTAPSGATNIQWFKDGVAVPGQVGTTYVASLAGSYYASYTDATTSCTKSLQASWPTSTSAARARTRTSTSRWALRSTTSTASASSSQTSTKM